ncbi:MAG: hypothetical protein RLZZ385_1904 [Pseudomonadota bacterium]|jgi:tol-pal system protein YbgF
MKRSWRASQLFLTLTVLVWQGNGWAAESANDALLMLLDQNRALQTEIQALRALVEEQGFELRRLQRESLDRYTDIDSRLSTLEQNPVRAVSPGVAGVDPLQSTTGPGANVSPAGSAATTPATVTGANSAVSAIGSPEAFPPGVASTTSPPVSSAVNVPSRPSLQPAVLSEQELYQMAYESAINSEFERAIAEFDQYLSIYPSGRFITNAHYWKGQSFLYLSRYQEAIAAYELILQQYPDAPKVPDAMYGLGVAYEALGNVTRARQLMQDIKRRFPNTGVANLADTRLLTLQ